MAGLDVVGVVGSQVMGDAGQSEVTLPHQPHHTPSRLGSRLAVEWAKGGCRDLAGRVGHQGRGREGAFRIPLLGPSPQLAEPLELEEQAGGREPAGGCCQDWGRLVLPLARGS